MKKISLFLVSVMLCFSFVACNSNEPEESDKGPKPSDQAGKNLIANWEGDGTKTPDAIGWLSTAQNLIPWATEASSTVGGCRFRTRGKTLDDNYMDEGRNAFTSTELMLRFDSNAIEGAVYGYETSEALIAGQTYTFSFAYHVGNPANRQKRLTVSAATSMDFTTAKGPSQSSTTQDEIDIHTLTSVVEKHDFMTNQNNMMFRTGTFSFEAKEDKKHFITFQGERDWYGVARLKLEIKL